MSPDHLEERIGDFEEGFALMVKRHDLGHARRWFLWQVFMIAARGAVYATVRVLKVWTDFGPA
jgi:hypothetical protein